MRIRRTLATAVVAAAALLAPAAAPAVAVASDALPTAWQLAARAESLQQAPPPPERPVICVVDVGVNQTPDLDIVDRVALDGGPVDDVTATPGTYGHGTTVAHMAAGAVNGWGSSGVFPHARIASVRVFPSGEGRVPWQEYVKGLQRCWYVRPVPKVALLSLGGSDATADERAELTNVIARTRDRLGMSVVAAAGNGGQAVDMPGRLPAPFTVAGATTAGALCGFSARGDGVDIAAPGCSLAQAGWDGLPWSVDGTSFAAPVVAGALAALRAYRADLSADETEQLLVRNAQATPVPTVDVAAALRAAGLAHLAAPAPTAPGLDVAAVPPEEPQAPRSSGQVGGAADGLERSRHQLGKRLPPPQARLRTISSASTVRVANRPRGATVVVRIRGRVVRRRSSLIALPIPARRAKIRFVRDVTSSLWVTVRTNT